MIYRGVEIIRRPDFTYICEINGKYYTGNMLENIKFTINRVLDIFEQRERDKKLGVDDKRPRKDRITVRRCVKKDYDFSTIGVPKDECHVDTLQEVFSIPYINSVRKEEGFYSFIILSASDSYILKAVVGNEARNIAFLFNKRVITAFL